MTKITAPSLSPAQVALLRAAGPHRGVVTAALWPPARHLADALSTDPAALATVPVAWVEHVLAIAEPSAAAVAVAQDRRAATTRAATQLGLSGHVAATTASAMTALAGASATPEEFMAALTRWARALPTRPPALELVLAHTATATEALADTWGAGATRGALAEALVAGAPGWLVAAVLAATPAWGPVEAALFTAIADTPWVLDVMLAGVFTATPDGAAALRDAYTVDVFTCHTPRRVSNAGTDVDPGAYRKIAQLFMHASLATQAEGTSVVWAVESLSVEIARTDARRHQRTLALATLAVAASHPEMDATELENKLPVWRYVYTPATTAEKMFAYLALRHPDTRAVVAAALHPYAKALGVFEQVASDDELVAYASLLGQASLTKGVAHLVACVDGAELRWPRMARALLLHVPGVAGRALTFPRVTDDLRRLLLDVLAELLGDSDVAGWQVALDLLDDDTTLASAAPAARVVVGS